MQQFPHCNQKGSSEMVTVILREYEGLFEALFDCRNNTFDGNQLATFKYSSENSAGPMFCMSGWDPRCL